LSSRVSHKYKHQMLSFPLRPCHLFPCLSLKLDSKVFMKEKYKISGVGDWRSRRYDKLSWLHLRQSRYRGTEIWPGHGTTEAAEPEVKCKKRLLGAAAKAKLQLVTKARQEQIGTKPGTKKKPGTTRSGDEKQSSSWISNAKDLRTPSLELARDIA
jgi:hypothetical protein